MKDIYLPALQPQPLPRLTNGDVVHSLQVRDEILKTLREQVANIPGVVDIRCEGIRTNEAPRDAHYVSIPIEVRLYALGRGGE